jgi:hypothetical protein
MNYINHLSRFYARLNKETRLNANHISLYLALFQCWNSYRFQNPFPLWRQWVMKVSGIGAKSTYGKCIRDLHRFGYIIYSQALHRFHYPKVSIVHLAGTPGVPELPFLDPAASSDTDGQDPGTGFDALPVPVLTALTANIDTAPVPDSDMLLLKIGTHPVPLLDHINKQSLNNINREREAHTQIPPSDRQQEMQTNTSRAAAAPSLDEVRLYFKDAGFPDEEASLFFSHYQANGWKQGGRIPIADWQAAACKWIGYDRKLRTISHAKFGKHNGTNHLHVQQDKDYSEPL